MSRRKDDESPPFIFVWLRAVRVLPLRPAVKNTAAWLASWADPDGTSIYPGLDLLARATGMHRATVVRCLEELREAKLIERDKRGGGRSKTGTADVYRLILPGYESPSATSNGGGDGGNESPCV